ncbi:MAG: head-tail connector protein [Steroidobacteraceae bacterium]
MSYLFKTAPLQEPLTLPEVKAHLRVDFDDDDAYIYDLVRAARWQIERRYRRALLTQTLVLGLDFFLMPEFTRDTMFPVSYWPPTGYQYPLNSILSLRPPVQSVTSVKYYDPSGILQTVDPATYQLDNFSEPARLAPALTHMWPTTAAIPNAVQIEFIAGATDPRLVPEDIKQAMKLSIGHWYENREDVVIGTRLVALQLPAGAGNLMKPYTRYLVM